MNPADLLAPPSPLGEPAPFWLLVTLKVLGFTLHMVALHLWSVGLLVALAVRARGGEAAQLWSKRLLLQLPLLVAAGVNLGVVPLLFLQVGYYRAFYPATILMAWPWFSVIALLAVAYSGVYAYAAGLRRGRPAGWRRAAGWLSAACFAIIGFLFANAMSLMTRLDAWAGLWGGEHLGGATRGLALDIGDRSLWPRWLLMLGLGLTTTAVHAVVDAGVLSPRNETYRRWAARFAVRLQTIGVLWFAACGSWYVFGTWQESVRSRMFEGPLALLTIATAAGPGIVWLLCVLQRREVTPRGAWWLLAAQIGVLASNAVSRQVVQNLELARWYEVAKQRESVHWSPLVVFLLLFVGGVVLLVWMTGKAVAASRGKLRADPLLADAERR